MMYIYIYIYTYICWQDLLLVLINISKDPKMPVRVLAILCKDPKMPAPEEWFGRCIRSKIARVA